MEGKWLETLWEKSIWVRGMIGALSLVAIVDYAFGWERLEFLEFTHAIVSLWDSALESVLGLTKYLLPWDLQWSKAERLDTAFYFILAIPAVFATFWKGTTKNVAPSNSDKLIAVLITFGILVLTASKGLVHTDSSILAGGLQHSPILFPAYLGIFVVLIYRAIPRYVTALLVGVSFIATLEVLYYMPLVQEWAKSFVEWSKNL